MALGRHQEHGLHALVEPGVHARHLELVFEIGHRPEPAHDDRGADLVDEVHEQDVEAADLQLRRLEPERREVLRGQRHPLVRVEQRALFCVDGDRHDQPVHHPEGTLDDVLVARGDRVEGPGIEANPLSHPVPLQRLPPPRRPRRCR